MKKNKSSTDQILEDLYYYRSILTLDEEYYVNLFKESLLKKGFLLKRQKAIMRSILQKVRTR